MELLIRCSWGLLGALHVMPALVLFAPQLVQRLYGVDPAGELGVLLVHRAAMFATVVVVAAYAIVDPSVRRLATLVTAISMISFLLVYLRAGMPAGQLQSIARADLAGLLPLAAVAIAAWRLPSSA